MLHDPSKHETLRRQVWSEARARACIKQIIAELDEQFIQGLGWSMHPLDEPTRTGETNPSLYFGATGVIWAMQYLRAVGAAKPRRTSWLSTKQLLELTRHWLGNQIEQEQASYLMGETPIRMLEFGQRPNAAVAEELCRLINFNLENPARELMWGSPGTLLSACFLFRLTGQSRWRELFQRTAARLKSQMVWSDEGSLWYWAQDLYGMHTSYIDAVHGFAGTALPLIAGRDLLDNWEDWARRIVQTMQCTAIREDGCASWPVTLQPIQSGKPEKKLMQYCHGAPGFVICLAELPGGALDQLLTEAGEATWRAGPLSKGCNLCHGTGGNGYAFLKLYGRTGEIRWLERARAFAMHGIEQFEQHASEYRQLRASLWTGDAGFAIYLWDCIRGVAQFPTLDVFYA